MRPDEQQTMENIEQSEFAAATLQLSLNTNANQMAQVTQNGIDAANTLRLGLVANVLGIMGDDRRLARELEPLEAAANKMPTQDYIVTLQQLIDMLQGSQPSVS